jgi:hypothetical protein
VIHPSVSLDKMGFFFCIEGSRKGLKNGLILQAAIAGSEGWKDD